MPKRRGCLGCSLPVLIVILIVFIAIFGIGFLAGPIGAPGLAALNKMSGSNLQVPGWIQTFSVPRPHPELPAEVVFHLFGFPVSNTILTAWITMIFLVVFSLAVSRRMKLIPGRLQAALEFLLGWLYDLCRSVAGDVNGRRFFPLIATIFLFVGFNAWLGLLPGYGSITIHTAEGEAHLLRPANTDINMPLAIAVIAVLFVQYFGLKTLKFHYIAKFVNVSVFFKSWGQLFRGKIGPGLIGLITGVVQMFVGFLEFLSEIIHVVSLTFRLFGNMTAGEILLLVVTFIVPWLFALPFYGLELLIGFIQAIIFSGLTLIFITLAVSPHEEEEAH